MNKYIKMLAKLIFSLGLRPIKPKNGSQGFLVYSTLTASDVTELQAICDNLPSWRCIYTESKYNPDGSKAPARAYIGPCASKSMTEEQLVAHMSETS